MRGLWVKLSLAFAGVVILSLLATSLLIGLATAGEFGVYVAQGNRRWAEALAPALANYYLQNRGWDGVESFLEPSSPMMPGMGPMHHPMGMGGAAMWRMMGHRFILADEAGRVRWDSEGTWVGTLLPEAVRNAGAPIRVGDRIVGWLVIGDTGSLSDPSAQFLGRVGWAIGWSTFVGIVLALGAGTLVFSRLVRPLRALQQAARRIAAGDLRAQIPAQEAGELGEVAQAFNRMAEALARAEQQRRQMLADIAHELRTPLGILQGHLEALIDGVLPLELEQIAQIHDEVRHLARLVEDLRLLTLAEAGQLRLDREMVDLKRLIEETVDGIALQAAEKGLHLEVEVPAELPPILADPTRIRQVLMNLLTNAVRYTPSGGQIVVRAQDLGDGVRVSVRDTGIGIAPEDLPHVFDRFYRAERSRSRADGGSGLGLAIARHLIEAHGGRIGVESTPGEGTCFFFTLPRLETIRGASPLPRGARDVE
ncbi:sensor histidine kinase [Thermoflexus sp.]|uniref:sensor histidine kinase n=1 Tax=Thermoflexus sp. TaxID=1969742 RepID=UPI0017670503|nr:ATP-binding protein [Thermoflexus sp.]